jgi:membrane protease YdiL (CAAX protease family)
MHLWIIPFLFGIVNLVYSFVPPSTSGTIVCCFIYTLLSVFTEELLFRGVFLGILSRKGILHGVIVSSILFGLFHLSNLSGSPQLQIISLAQVIWATFIGIGFAATRIRTNALWPAILIHFLINFTNNLTDRTISTESLVTFLCTIIGVFSLLGAYGAWLLRPSALAQIQQESDLKKSEGLSAD